MNGVGGVGRGRGRGRIVNKVDLEERAAFFKTSKQKFPVEWIQPLKKEDRPIQFKMGLVSCVGRGVGKNLSPAVAEMVKNVQLELFNRDYYFKHYLPNAPVQGHFGSVVKELPPPKEKKNDDRVDIASKANKKFGGLAYPHPRNRRPFPVDPEVEAWNLHLRKKKQDQNERERMRHDQVRRLGHVRKSNQRGSDSDEDSEELERKRKSKQKLLEMARKMRMTESDGEEDKRCKGRKAKEEKRQKKDRLKEKRKAKDDANGWEFD